MSIDNFDRMAKILLIGESGSGKSTLINYLFNYFHQNDLNHLKIAVPCKYHPYSTEQLSHNELNLIDTTQLKTNICTQYIFTDQITEKQYLFLDTPGLSDTRGIEQNETNMNQIIDAITQLGSLSTVIIVVNGSISRLTTSFRSILTCLYGNLPDSILENVLIVLTNAKKHESSFDLRILNLHGNVYPFYMQNNAFVSDCRTWTNSIRDELEFDWKHSMKQIQQIVQTIDSFQHMSIESFIQMKQIRNDIKLILHQMRLELSQMRQIENELTQFTENHNRIQTIELIDTSYPSTICLNCHQVCHRNCRLNETIHVGAQIFAQCSSMINGQCQQCRNHCSYIDHYHAKKTICITEQTLENVLNELTLKYNQDTIETKNLLEQTLKQHLDLLKSKSSDLCRICSSFDLVRELKYLIKHYKIERNLTKNYENDQFIKSLVKLTRLIDEHQEKNIPKQQSTMKIICRNEIDETSKPKEINNLKTNDLIDLYNRTNDRLLLHSISEELHRRVQGKSLGPLITTNEIMLTNKFIEKYKQKTVQELSYACRQIQKRINQILDSDIFKIVNIDLELLIENFILHTLLDEKEKDENLPYPTEQATNTNVPVSLGFSHLTTTPYPTTNPFGSLLPSLPLDNSNPSNYPPTPPYPLTPFQPENYQYNPTNFKSLTSINSPQRSNIGFSFQNSRETSLDDSTSIPDIIPSNHSSRQTSKLQDTAEPDSDKFRSIETSRLLLMYASAILREKDAQRIAAYKELYQRCFGDNPFLIKQNRQLLQEKLQFYQEKTFDELRQAQRNNQQQISKYIRNDDVTFIEDIPVELVVEAHALKQLISS